MADFIDYYEVLGVSEDASADEIKRAWRRLMKRHHTDVGGSHEMSVILNRAYETLTDPQERAAYDASRGNGPSSSRASAGFETQEAAFATGGWPNDTTTSAAFGITWELYRAWLSSGRQEAGEDYLRLRAALEHLVITSLDVSARAGDEYGDLFESVAASFPAIVPTEAFVRAMLHIRFRTLPDVDAITFPRELDLYYEAAVRGQWVADRSGDSVNGEVIFLDRAVTYLLYVAKYFPRLISDYVLAARLRYSDALGLPPYERLLNALLEEDVEAALDRWGTWSEGYYATGGGDHERRPSPQVTPSVSPSAQQLQRFVDAVAQAREDAKAGRQAKIKAVGRLREQYPMGLAEAVTFIEGKRDPRTEPPSFGGTTVDQMRRGERGWDEAWAKQAAASSGCAVIVVVLATTGLGLLASFVAIAA